MREIAAGLTALLAGGRGFALAMTVGGAGSSPRPAGAAMAVADDGSVLGSLSGGCVESALYARCEQVLLDGIPVLESYETTADGLVAGLPCGGSMDVLVLRVDGEAREVLTRLLVALTRSEPVVLAVVTAGPALGALWLVRASSDGVDGVVPDVVAEPARGLLEAGVDTSLAVEGAFLRAFSPPSRLLIFGATDFAAAVATVGRFLGFHVTVCDARPVFAVPERFPAADEVVCAWPHRYFAGQVLDERTAVCVLTHDPKFDLPLLELALRAPVGYVGAMGSRRTHADRLDRLRERGLTEAELARLHSPIGLDIGARSPQETAVSVAAELVAVRWGGTGRPLSTLEGAIHADRR